MGHSHDTQETQSQKQLLTAFLLNTSFVFIEIIGGFLTNSVAILSDALHDLGDSFALGVAWYFERISGRKRNAQHTYGFRRYSVLGAVINALVLIAGSALVIREAVHRLGNPEPVNSLGMLGLAVLGVIVNGFAFSRIHKGHSQNVEVVRLHLLEDVLGWVAVLIGAVVIHFTGYTSLDAIISLAVSAWILIQVIRRLFRSLRIILQLAPDHITSRDVDEIVQSIEEVRTTHDTHIWTLDGEFHIATLHVVIDEHLTTGQLMQIKAKIRNALLKVRISHTTIEFEYPGEDCVYIDEKQI